jgi:hypothetical protein
MQSRQTLPKRIPLEKWAFNAKTTAIRNAPETTISPRNVHSEPARQLLH